MNTAKGVPSLYNNDIRMGTAKNTLAADVRMNTAVPGTTVKKNAFKPWEKEILGSSEVQRKATVAQLCMSAKLFPPHRF